MKLFALFIMCFFDIAVESTSLSRDNSIELPKINVHPKRCPRPPLTDEIQPADDLEQDAAGPSGSSYLPQPQTSYYKSYDRIEQEEADRKFAEQLQNQFKEEEMEQDYSTILPLAHRTENIKNQVWIQHKDFESINKYRDRYGDVFQIYVPGNGFLNVTRRFRLTVFEKYPGFPVRTMLLFDEKEDKIEKQMKLWRSMDMSLVFVPLEPVYVVDTFPPLGQQKQKPKLVGWLIAPVTGYMKLYNFYGGPDKYKRPPNFEAAIKTLSRSINRAKKQQGLLIRGIDKMDIVCKALSISNTRPLVDCKFIPKFVPRMFRSSDQYVWPKESEIHRNGQRKIAWIQQISYN